MRYFQPDPDFFYPPFFIPLSAFSSSPYLTQEFQATGLFSKVIAYKFFQKLRALPQGSWRKFYSGGLGQVSAFDPLKLFNRAFGKRYPCSGAGCAGTAENTAPF